MNMAQVQSQEVVFGDRYWLTRPLAVGGMAEVFLAKFQTKDGFWLISAGSDRKYGTKDDICNFGVIGK